MKTCILFYANAFSNALFPFSLPLIYQICGTFSPQPLLIQIKLQRDSQKKKKGWGIEEASSKPNMSLWRQKRCGWVHACCLMYINRLLHCFPGAASIFYPLVQVSAACGVLRKGRNETRWPVFIVEWQELRVMCVESATSAIVSFFFYFKELFHNSLQLWNNEDKHIFAANEVFSGNKLCTYSSTLIWAKIVQCSLTLFWLPIVGFLMMDVRTSTQTYERAERFKASCGLTETLVCKLKKMFNSDVSNPLRPEAPFYHGNCCVLHQVVIVSSKSIIHNFYFKLWTNMLPRHIFGYSNGQNNVKTYTIEPKP